MTRGLASLLLSLSLLACGSGDGASLDQNRPPGDEPGGAAGHAGAAGTGGRAGAPMGVPPSCLARTPGADLACGQTADHDCCESLPVPGGSAFLNFNGVQKEKSHKDWPFSVSAFRLDKYEVTVGRFRAFLHALPVSRPKAGDGAHPLIAGSGWDSSWPLVSSESEFAAALALYFQMYPNPEQQCHWGQASETSENLPMGCLTWYELFAFCAWDGGRLPTSHEWFFAAAGGSQQRVFPWSSPPSSTSTDGIFPGINYPGYQGLLSVGSFPKDAGRWGHADLLGNVSERTLDTTFTNEHHLTYPCSDCALLGGGDDKSTRDLGWGFSSVSADEGLAPIDSRYTSLGGRCARHP